MTADRRFQVRTIPAKHPRDLLAGLHGPGPLAWVRRGDGLIGWGETATITVPAGSGRFGVADGMLRALGAHDGDVPPPLPRPDHLSVGALVDNAAARAA